MKIMARWLSLGAITCATACGSTAGEAVRPADQTFAGAARGQGPAPVCHEVLDEGTPLIVDWNPEERGDLEVAMKQGVAVVHFDCNSLRVLPECHVEGSYGFLGTTKKEQVISLDNADQAQANLPLNGAKIGAGLTRGSTIDIGLVMIGKRSTTFTNIDRSLLTGRCDGATHFVQSATVGAFAMKTSTAGEVKAVADVFSFGGSASSASNKSVNSKDGDIASCQQADVDGVKAPNGCGALLRVRLLGLTEGDKAPPKKTEAAPAELKCAKGLVPVKGKCAVPAPDAPVCDVGKSVVGCVKQCDDGDATGCSMASLVYSLGIDVPQDDKKSAALDQRACDLAVASCGSIATDYLVGSGVAQDKPKAAQLYLKACNGGNAQSCTSLAKMYLGGPKGLDAADNAKALKYAQRGCDAGDAFGCSQVAGLTPDKASAVKMLRLACYGNDVAACVSAGSAYEKGDGATANPGMAKVFYKRACDAKSKAGCDHLKKLGGT